MELVLILKVLLMFFFIILAVLIMAYVIILLKNRNSNSNKENIDLISSKTNNKVTKKHNTKTVINNESIYDFMEFQEIKDNMIIRNNRKQYIMVVRCKGINYDLMSEEEKVSIEAGFVEFLNTLRFPIQLYIQTTSLNLRDIIEEYKDRIQNMEKDIRKTEDNMRLAKSNGDEKQYNKFSFEKRRKENVLEYGADIAEYISRMSGNRDILQQKTYLVISYYSAEIETSGSFSDDEIDNLCFSELYTRTQTAIRALGSAGVVGKILNSEELSELLYVAYNRDESEVMSLKKALDAEYDALYSTGRDALEKKKEVLNDMIDREAVNLATNSITIADEKRRNEEKIAKKALEILDEYKNQMDDELYQKSKEEVLNSKKDI